jgi:NADH dehydrogenase [ubiquinone] 1 alpha subcomplex assembly factor 7
MAADPSPLEAEIRRLISVAGPMPVAHYVELCLTHPEHGYYMRQDPFGASGDFTTGPEISQMFGELAGLWAAHVFKMMGSPDTVRLVELGPGRGTMMVDALRAAKAAPAFRRAISVHLVEISPVLERQQRRTLGGLDVPIVWHNALTEVPEGPVIALANEFIDALPVHQAIKRPDGWHERVIEVDSGGKLVFGLAYDALPHFEQVLPKQVREAPVGSLYEWRADHTAHELGRRVAREGGAALVMDYGQVQSYVGDTLQAVRNHAFSDPLATPGMADITAHVDFQALADAAESMGAAVHGPVTQGVFLRRLGIDARTAALRNTAPKEKLADIEAAYARLTGGGPAGMGELFKVMAIADRKLGPLPGLEG